MNRDRDGDKERLRDRYIIYIPYRAAGLMGDGYKVREGIQRGIVRLPERECSRWIWGRMSGRGERRRIHGQRGLGTSEGRLVNRL